MKKIVSLIILLLILNNCTSNNYNFIIIKKNVKNEKNFDIKNLYIINFENDKYGFTSYVYNRFLDLMMYNNKPFLNKIYFKKVDDNNSRHFPKLNGNIKKFYVKKTEYSMIDQQKENFKIYKKCTLYKFLLSVDYKLYFPTFNDKKNVKTYKQYDICINGNIDENLVKKAIINENIDNYLNYIKEKLK